MDSLKFKIFSMILVILFGNSNAKLIKMNLNVTDLCNLISNEWIYLSIL